MKKGGLLTGLVAAGVAGVATWAAMRRLRDRPPGDPEQWERKNYRGNRVSLAAGPAVCAGAAAGVALAPGLPRATRLAGAATALVVGGVGLYDDLAAEAASKGLKGHLGALRERRVTSGVMKIGVIGLSGLISAAAVSDNALDTLVGGAAIAGHANLVNLLDLRPGRANKVVLAHAPLVFGGPGRAVGAAALGASAASIGDDVGERVMLGDAGANALGAMLGLALVAREGRGARLAHLAVVTAATLASEKVSFTEVIDRTPFLRRLDQLGRLP